MKNPVNEIHLVGATLFEWDRLKASSNFKKHGISFLEAASVFADAGALLLTDPEHSVDEERFILLGISAKERMLTVVHAERRHRLRIISAWPATKEERSMYEEKGEG